MLQGSLTPQAAQPDHSARDAASALADEAWALVGADARKAQRLAVRALSAANAARNPAAASVAHRALGMTAIDLRGADEALAHLRRAVAAGRRAESAQLVAEADMTLALALQLSGDATAALRHAGSAMRAAPQSARLGLQHALILERSGRLSQALERYAVVERLAVVTGDQDTLARVLGNRGVLQIYLGDYPAAADDILRAEALCQELGLTLMVAASRANLGYLAARRGNVVEALRWLERARPELEAAGNMRHGIFQFDLCEVLLTAGLWRDAVAAGRGAIDLLTRTGMQAELAEARLLTAQAALRDGDPATAEHLATAAGRAFSRQRRPPWAALAREVVVRAQWASGRRDEAMLASARRVAASLDEAGWATNGSSARILAARLALELGHPQVARTELERASAHDRGPAWMRIQALHGRALLCAEHGDVRGAETALHAGWTAIEEHRVTLGATELRIGASAHTSELAELGVRLALRSGSPEGALRWAERGRAGMLDRPAAHAPADAQLAAKLDELRAVVAMLESAAKDGEDTRGLVGRQAQLEDEVRSRARLADASTGEARVLDVDPDALHGALGERALAELVVCDATLWAVVAAEGRLTLHDLGEAAAAARESAALRMALGRLAAGAGAPEPLRRAARDAATRAAALLAAQVVGPLVSRTEERPLVLVPTGALHGTPWAALPGIAPVLSVAPSAGLWMRGHAIEPLHHAPGDHRSGARSRLTDGVRVLVAAGPRLAHAVAEAEDVAQRYPDAEVTLAPYATVEEVRKALPTVDLAHLACHGHFRDDNPLFSALEFAGGRLSVFELERLSRVPRHLVLSACDSGRAAVRPGDELIGLTAALLRLGTQSLVASVLPVPDDATRRLMTALHGQLAAGLAPPHALAAARLQLDTTSDADLVAAAAFVAFGSD